MSFQRLLAIVLVAGLVSGCGTSSVTDTALETQSLGAQVKDPATLAAQVSRAGNVSKKEHPASARKVAEKLSAAANPSSSAYRIGPLDVLDVSVFKVADLSKSVQVSDSGTVNLPLVGEINAAGRTAREVEHELTKKWGAKYLQNPQVTVFIKEYNSQRITIEGAVKKPGVFPIRGQMSLIQAIATAQGLDDNSDLTVLVFRDHNGKRSAARFDIADIRSGTAIDPSLQAGDVVVAGSSAMKATFNSILKALPIASVFALI